MRGLLAFLIVAAQASLAYVGPHAPHAPPATSGAPRMPRRVVSLAPNFTEVIRYLGAADRLVGVTVYCEGVDASVARVGTFRDPNVEQIIALAPDLVLAISGQEQGPLVRGLALHGGIRVEVLPGDRIEDLEVTVRRLGDWLGAPARAREFLLGLEAVLAAPPPPRDAPRLLFVVDHDPLYLAGGGCFLQPLFGAAGFRNVLEERGEAWIQADLEEVAARDPDCIVDVTLSDPVRAPFAPWPRLHAHLRAARAGRIYAFPEVRCGIQVCEWADRLRVIQEECR